MSIKGNDTQNTSVLCGAAKLVLFDFSHVQAYIEKCIDGFYYNFYDDGYPNCMGGGGVRKRFPEELLNNLTIDGFNQFAQFLPPVSKETFEEIRRFLKG